MTVETRKMVGSLRKGDRIRGMTLLAEVVNFKQTRDGKHFLQMILRDRTASVRAVRWEATVELYRSFGVGDFVRVDGRVEEFQQNLQVVVDGISRADDSEVEPSDFLAVGPRPAAELEEELRGHLADVTNPALARLLNELLSDDELRDAFFRCPAGKALHHAYIGGLAEHALSLIRSAKLIAQNYQNLDVDILIAAAILHDLGKVDELTYSRSFGYSDRGQLVGHIAIGIVLLARAVARVDDFPNSLHVRLEHIISSHHGVPEHGALKEPATPEAIAFHFLDNLDAKMAMLDDMKRELPPGEATDGGRWTEYKPALGKRIWFPE